MSKKIIKVKQHDITDCGAACLSSISQYYGYNLPISRIRQFASTDKKGTNVLGMVEAAEKQIAQVDNQFFLMALCYF